MCPHTRQARLGVQTVDLVPDVNIEFAEAPLAEVPLAEAPLAEAPLAEAPLAKPHSQPTRRADASQQSPPKDCSSRARTLSLGVRGPL